MPRAMSTAISGMSARPLEKNQVEQTGGERREGGGEEEIVQVRDQRLAMAATP